MVSDKMEGKMFPPSVLRACMLRAVTHSASMADTTYRIIFPALTLGVPWNGDFVSTRQSD